MKVTWVEFWGLIIMAFIFSLISHWWDSGNSFWLVFFSIVVPFLILLALKSVSEDSQKEKDELLKLKQDLSLTQNKQSIQVNGNKNKPSLSEEKLQQIEKEKNAYEIPDELKFSNEWGSLKKRMEKEDQFKIEKSIKRHNKK